MLNSVGVLKVKPTNLLMDYIWEIRKSEKSSFCFLFKNKETGRMKLTFNQIGKILRETDWGSL